MLADEGFAILYVFPPVEYVVALKLALLPVAYALPVVRDVVGVVYDELLTTLS